MNRCSYTIRLWVGRILIGIVLVINLQCALAFLWKPEFYIASFELPHGSGEPYLRGIGLLFLMWNVPYAIAALNPLKYRVSLYEAIVMQTMGVLGESLILWTIPIDHPILRASITRFILFDAAGLLALLLSFLITRNLVGKISQI